MGWARWVRRGCRKALEVIHRELDVTMALCGERDVHNLGAHNLILPQGFADPTVPL
jgi:L-lactate dehydrogenase (cytochrome)